MGFRYRRFNTGSLVLAMLCAAREKGGGGLSSCRALVVPMMSRPRVRAAKRLLPLGALRETHDIVSSATSRWRQSVTGPAVGCALRTPLSMPTRDAVPLSTLDRRSSSRRPQNTHEGEILPIARSPNGHLRNDLVIHTTASEAWLFKILLQMINEEKMGTTLRVAGGWVRDKLVGQEQTSHQRKLNIVNKMDIDIALDNCMGGDFAARLNSYMMKQDYRRTTVTVIASNPEKSKHLETATVKIGGFWVDFVNLRKESYVHDSRIPSINIGTPIEDAFRRDLTINSLFYNINTGMVEDFTGKGTADLRLGLVRTPLPPCETLLDDPLRILRAVRFASRLGFRVHPELMEAGKDPRVHRALENKVSRERVGSEVDQMVRSQAPLRAFQLMEDLDLLPLVFPVPEDVQAIMDDDRRRALEFGMVYLKNMYHLLDEDGEELGGFSPFGPLEKTATPTSTTTTTTTTTPGPSIRPGKREMQSQPPQQLQWTELQNGGEVANVAVVGDSEQQPKKKKNAKASGKGNAGGGGGGGGVMEDLDKTEMRRLGMYAAFLFPLSDTRGKNARGKSVPIINVLMADRLKLRARDPERVQLLIGAALDFQRVLRTTVRGPLTRANSKSVVPSRLAVGKTLRTVGPLWRVALVLGLTGDLGTKHILANSFRGRTESEEDAAVISAYVSMGKSIEDMGLEGVWNLKPLLDGLEIQKLLPNLPRGPVFARVIKKQIDWLLENPEGTKEEVGEYLKAEFEKVR